MFEVYNGNNWAFVNGFFDIGSPGNQGIAVLQAPLGAKTVVFTCEAISADNLYVQYGRANGSVITPSTNPMQIISSGTGRMDFASARIPKGRLSTLTYVLGGTSNELIFIGGDYLIRVHNWTVSEWF